MRKIRNMIIVCALLLFCFSMTVSAHEHEGHDYTTGDKVYYNSTYHQIYHYCNTCKQSFDELEKHQSAATWHKGDDENWDVYLKKDIPEWEYGYPCCGTCYYSASLDYALTFKNSAQIKIELTGNVCKGDVIKVKVGNKTYKKKLKKNTGDPIIKLKIKKPKKNYKINVWISHAGKKIYLGCDYVKTSEKPQIGMTKSQVRKYTLWLYNFDEDEIIISHYSNGCIWSSYRDGSYIIFEKGKVIDYYIQEED